MPRNDPIPRKAATGARQQEAARLMLAALRILDEEGSPAAARLAMALDDLGIATPVPPLAASDGWLDGIAPR